MPRSLRGRPREKLSSQGGPAHRGPPTPSHPEHTRFSSRRCGWLTSCGPERGSPTVLGRTGNVPSPSESESDVFRCRDWAYTGFTGRTNYFMKPCRAAGGSVGPPFTAQQCRRGHGRVPSLLSESASPPFWVPWSQHGCGCSTITSRRPGRRQWSRLALSSLRGQSPPRGTEDFHSCCIGQSGVQSFLPNPPKVSGTE